jgi:putative metalloprotease
MKKNLLIVTVLMFAVGFNANAQFGKALKKVGKTVEKAAAVVVDSPLGDLAQDLTLNTLSDNIVLWMDNHNVVLPDDSPYTVRLASIVAENYVEVDGTGFYYKVYENPEVNIIACADGCIRVYSGLMDAFTDDEVLGIITNQIGHIVNKDARNALVKVTKKDQAGNAASAQLDKMLAGEGVGTIVNELLQVPYNDEQNRAADRFAVSLLKKNGKDASGLVSALTKLAELETADTEAAESGDTFVEYSPAVKFNKVNSNNAARVAAIR